MAPIPDNPNHDFTQPSANRISDRMLLNAAKLRTTLVMGATGREPPASDPIARRTRRVPLAITGIASLVYGVDDVQESARFFDDFGLCGEERRADFASFRLPEGSSVVIRKHSDP